MEMTAIETSLFPDLEVPRIPATAAAYPEFRYMGSKRRLMPWIFEVLSQLDFDSAMDPFCGSGCVSYLLKCMGKRVTSRDFLEFPATLAKATVENSSHTIDGPTMKLLLGPGRKDWDFIERTFQDIFYAKDDLQFLDRISFNIAQIDQPQLRALAHAALIRSCLKKQPRGVFTFAGNRYDDGRRDLRLSIEEHFHEQVDVFNRIIFPNGKRNTASRGDVFSAPSRGIDLVYLDPPYVPRSDDNCYIKRYHFLEGLVTYWKDSPVMETSKVKKLGKRFTPFSYRKTAAEAFDAMFKNFKASKIVLSYSSNGFPDLAVLEELMGRYKASVTTYKKPHRYHFGTHAGVQRANVDEYLIVGT
jgi:DNA adenine methylase/adenine-specific DNA-methyltransferase